MRMPALRYRYRSAAITQSIANRPTRSQRTPAPVPGRVARRVRALGRALPRAPTGRLERGWEADAAGMLDTAFAPAHEAPATDRAGISSDPLASAEGGTPGELRVGAQLLLDAQKLVVLRDPVRARGGAGLDLPAPGRDRQVGDAHVLGLT